MQHLLIAGPAGVGKSTLSLELGAELINRQVAHAVVEVLAAQFASPFCSQDTAAAFTLSAVAAGMEASATKQLQNLSRTTKAE